MIYNKKRKQPIVHAAWLAMFNGKVGCFLGDRVLKLRILLWILRALNAGASGVAEMFPFLNDKLESIHCTPFPWDPKTKRYIMPKENKPYGWNLPFFQALDFICECLLFLYPEDGSFVWKYYDHCGMKKGREKFSPWYLNDSGIKGFHRIDAKTNFIRTAYENMIVSVLNSWTKKGLTVYHVFCNEGITKYVPSAWEWYKNISTKIYVPKKKTPEQYMMDGFQNKEIPHQQWKSIRKAIVGIATNKKRPRLAWRRIEIEVENMIEAMGKRKAAAWGHRIEFEMRATRHQSLKRGHLSNIVANPIIMPKQKSSVESNDGDSVKRDENGKRIRHTGQHIVKHYHEFIKRAFKKINPFSYAITREWFFEFLCWNNTFECQGIRDFAILAWKDITGKSLHKQGQFDREIQIVDGLIKVDETQDIDLETVFLAEKPPKKPDTPNTDVTEDPPEELPKKPKKKEKKHMKNFVDFKGYFDTIKEKFFAPMFILSMALAGIVGYWIKPRFIMIVTGAALVGYIIKLIVDAIKK
jgi:hypothetical protein